MTRLKSILMFSLEFFVVFCCITGTAFGINSTDNKSAQPGDNLSNEISNVDYSYYNYFFGLNSYGNTVITRYGKLPVLETEGQKESWNSTLEELSNKIKDTLASKYMYPYGEVMTCGINAKGYLVILFKYGNVDESLMNELYSLIDSSAKEMGIQDIPVEFGYGIYQAEIPLDKEQGIYHTYSESTENLSESEIQAIEEYMKEKPEKLWGDGQIAYYGKIPLLKNKKDLESWGNKLFSIKNGTEGKISPYFDRNQIVMYGIELTRLEVVVYEGLPSEEKATLVKEIYQIIDEEARKRNVIDIPVVFEEGGYYQPMEELENEDMGIEEINFSSSEKNTTELNNTNINDSEFNNEDKPSKIKSTPGFGLLGSLTCLYGGWKLRKK
ncbi:hypothetical protein [Methanosarcina sp. UBA411]|uniref:hypothetical protein n=1 Tax=Methanosarcina sp. UBA411 TaxID=1915589 RepID=UPI0025F5C876|nr:hypothetical protein [Methanosarcina sp. UBA411]